MYWEENKEENRFIVPDDVADISFAISCRCLKVDHAYVLYRAIRDVLPWFGADDESGVHPIHVADSGNGWMRPDKPDDLLYLSRRTRLVLRVPATRLEAAQRLTGSTLDIGGHELSVHQGAVKKLSAITTLFSRYIVVRNAPDESGFLAEMMKLLQTMGIRPKKMLCGMEHIIRTPEENHKTRSLMIVDLTTEESLKLQQRGLGPYRHLGCGLFIPHKDIKEVKQNND